MPPRPSFHDLTPDQQLQFGNGVGPYWWPRWARAVVTGLASWFFKSASWRHHDFGYSIGYTAAHRRLYDWKFLVAMLRDAVRQPMPVVPVAIIVATIFWIAVRVGGRPSFYFGNGYRSLIQILADFEAGKPPED